MRRVVLASCLLGLCPVVAQAQSFEVRGFVELRGAVAPDETGWLDGGLGKARHGGGGEVVSGGGAIALSWQATPSLLAVASAQVAPEQRQPFDVLDAWVRYRPVSTTPWRWSATAGAFFPPISLENDGVGWTSTWTLTPSAINSWVGEELRVFGGELRVERRSDGGTLDLRAAVFGRNDPAGELLASRGWALGDLTSGIDAVLRQPDVHARTARAPVPVLFRPFVEIDDRAGWYAALGWESGDDRARLMYYDNRTDPSLAVRYAGRNVFGWHTRFWSAGAQRRLGDWLLVGQAMAGGTAIEPAPGRLFDTRFHAGYLLAVMDQGRWQPALRIDLFGTRQEPDRPDAPREHGNALTFALNWRPHERVRVTGEVLRIDSNRTQRRAAGLAPRQVDTQVQLGVRVFF